MYGLIICRSKKCFNLLSRLFFHGDAGRGEDGAFGGDVPHALGAALEEGQSHAWALGHQLDVLRVLQGRAERLRAATSPGQTLQLVDNCNRSNRVFLLDSRSSQKLISYRKWVWSLAVFGAEKWRGAQVAAAAL